MNISISPKGISQFLLAIVSFLLIAHLTVIFIKVFTGHEILLGLIPLFDIGAEKNIPTFYSAIAIIISSALLWVIALKHKKSGLPYFYWVGLACIFLFLSFDEIASIHERLMEPLRVSLNTSGLLYFAWVIPYGLALIVFVLGYIPFLLRLPRKTMKLFVMSGAIYVAGAVGFELLGGKEAELHGFHSNWFYLFVIFEETLEMLGIVLFIYSLLDYICEEFEFISVTIRK